MPVVALDYEVLEHNCDPVYKTKINQQVYQVVAFKKVYHHIAEHLLLTDKPLTHPWELQSHTHSHNERAFWDCAHIPVCVRTACPI